MAIIGNNNPALMKIHQALHDPAKPAFVQVEGRLLPIKLGLNGCRKTEYRGETVMEQNMAKTTSEWTQRCLQTGEKISWVMHKGKEWTQIITK